MVDPGPKPSKTAVLAKLLPEQSPLCAACISAKSRLALRDIASATRRFEIKRRAAVGI